MKFPNPFTDSRYVAIPDPPSTFESSLLTFVHGVHSMCTDGASRTFKTTQLQEETEYKGRSRKTPNPEARQNSLQNM